MTQMTFRRSIKRWLYDSCPFFRGSFPYFGTTVFFPKGSHLFRECCRQGVYERDMVQLVDLFIKPDTWYFDVGANIGLMAIPFLERHRGLKVASFEPSPNTLPYLERTHSASSFTDRWKIVSKAASDSVGTTSFHLASAAEGAFDGSRNTGRVRNRGETVVDTTTIDHEWQSLGKPRVSAIKIDVEGAEMSVLRGAKECIRANRPSICTEWNSTNIKAYHCDPGCLLEFAREVDYDVFSLPDLSHVCAPLQLRAITTLRTENFLMLPSARRAE
jgi:FkbM family methyltransferase